VPSIIKDWDHFFSLFFFLFFFKKKELSEQNHNPETGASFSSLLSGPNPTFSRRNKVAWETTG